MRALLVLAMLAASPAFACKCDPDAVARLSANPEIAETALLGKAEAFRSKKVFRVAASWTKYTGAFVLPESSKCDLRPALGKSLIFLSIHSLDWFDEHKASPTICDSILLVPAKAAKAVAKLAAKTDYSNHFAFNPSWGWCRRDAECLLAADVCGGEAAIASRSRDEHEKWRARTAPTVNCAVSAAVSSSGKAAQPRARCVENFCAAYSPAP